MLSRFLNCKRGVLNVNLREKSDKVINVAGFDISRGGVSNEMTSEHGLFVLAAYNCWPDWLPPHYDPNNLVNFDWFLIKLSWFGKGL